MITMLQIREMYPHYQAMPEVSDWSIDQYGVSGAVCRVAYGLDDRFTSESRLAYALEILNPALDQDDARVAARAIVEHEERQELEAAWAVVDQALSAPAAPEPR